MIQILVPQMTGYSLPRTNAEHKLSVGVDEIQDLPIFRYRLSTVKTFYRTGQYGIFQVTCRGCINWYKRACRLGLQTKYAPHHPDVFRVKGIKSMILSPILKTTKNMYRLKELGVEMDQLWCM